jgi:hypothetical protein
MGDSCRGAVRSPDCPDKSDQAPYRVSTVSRLLPTGQGSLTAGVALVLARSAHGSKFELTAEGSVQ